jgi:hypothetical protein
MPWQGLQAFCYARKDERIQEMYMGLVLAFAGLARASKLSWHAYTM